jgi:hypothetical protein
MNFENAPFNLAADNNPFFHRTLVRLVPWWALVCFLGWCWIYLSPNHSMDDADPEILNQAWRLVKHESIYGRVFEGPPFVHAAYTPIYYCLTGAAMRFTGLSFFPAAFLSLLASVALLAAFIYSGRKQCGSWKWGVWVGCLLFLVPAMLYNSVRAHPQMLAVAFAVWGYIFFDKRRFLPTAIISPVLAVLSIYTKQTMIALPVASLIWLLLKKRGWLLSYLLTLSVAGLAPLAWLQWTTGGNFWLNTVTLNQLIFRAVDIPLVLIHHAGPLVFFIGLALVVLIRRFRSSQWAPIDIYFIATAAVTILSCGRTGAYTQYVVEFCTVVMLYVLYAAGMQTLKSHRTLVKIQLIALFLYAPLYVALEHGPYALASRRASSQILSLVRSDPGPILSQNGSFALFGSGQIYIQMFDFTAFYRMGLWDGQKLVLDIENKKLRWVITQFDIWNDRMSDDDKERFAPEVVMALRKTYALRQQIGPYYIYR